MDYWRRKNFEGLLALVKALAEEPLWAEYAHYCHLRERGLRKPALRAMDRFVAIAAHWSSLERRRFTVWLFEKRLEFPDVYDLIPHPLGQNLLIPTLEEWKRGETHNDLPCRLLGIATQKTLYFKEALALNPQDDFSRAALLEETLRRVDFQCHHLPDYFIGTPLDALEALISGDRLIIGFIDTDTRENYQEKINRARSLVQDWIHFKESGESDFGAWCESVGRPYPWGRTYSYSYLPRSTPNTA